MELLPWVFTAGWASGINAYLVVLMLGAADRLFTLGQIPDALGRNDVLIAAGVLFLIDVVADKIPFIDSVWDGIHTVVRPGIAAVLGALLAGDVADVSTLSQAVAATGGGLTALASHGVKAGIRAAVNTSPEPASNAAVSFGEDFTVAAIVSVALIAPWLAAAVAAALLLTGAVLVVLLLRRIRAWRRRRAAQVSSQPWSRRSFRR